MTDKVSPLIHNVQQPWERKEEFVNQQEILQELRKQTDVMAEQREAMTHNYPVCVQESYSYERFLDQPDFSGMEDELYSLSSELANVSDYAQEMSRGISDVTQGINEMSLDIRHAMGRNTAIITGVVGYGVYHLSGKIGESSVLISRTINDRSTDIQEAIYSSTSFLVDTIDSNFGNLIFHLDNLTDCIVCTAEQIHSALLENRQVIQSGFDQTINVLQNSRKTDAEEHFRDAMKFYKNGCKFSKNREWFKDALKHFEASVDLYNCNPLAHLLIGHIYHYQPEIRDLSKAIKHYHLCQVFAEPNKNRRALAAQGCYFAGWLSAVHNKDLKLAIDYSLKAIKFNREHHESRYNLAKFCSLRGDVNYALQHLRYLITSANRNYLVRALADPDFLPINKHLKMLIDSLRKEASKDFNLWLSRLSAQSGEPINYMKELLAEIKSVLLSKDERHGNYFDLFNEITSEGGKVAWWENERYEQLAELRKTVNAKNTYFGYRDACAYASELEDFYADEVGAEKNTIKNDLFALRDEITKKVSDIIAEEARIEMERIAEEKRQKREKNKAEKARLAEEARLETLRVAEEKRKQKEKDDAEIARLAEEARLETLRVAEEKRKQKEKDDAEIARLAEEARLETLRVAEEKRKQKEKDDADKARLVEEARLEMERVTMLKKAKLHKFLLSLATATLFLILLLSILFTFFYHHNN